MSAVTCPRSGADRCRTAAGALLAVLALILGAATQPAAAGVPFERGDVLASVGNGKVKHFKPDGTLVQVLDTTTGSHETTGGCFDDEGNFYVTSFTANEFSKFDADGDLVDADFADGFNASPESCLQLANGDFLVGQANGTGDVLRFGPAGGTPIDSFDVAREDRGSDWIDLAADGCTLFYTSEGTQVKRFDICTETQLLDFASGLPRPCFAMKIRPNGEVMAACQPPVRLSPAGTPIQSYTLPGSGFPFALNLDPDGETFWTGDILNGEVWRVDIETGAIVEQFNAAPFTTLAGLTIVGETLVSDEGPAGDATCSDTLDNDQDGLTDLADPDCQEPEGPPGDPTCSDGIDNDQDGQVDAADPGCQGTVDDEGPPGDPTCSDGIDNDNDGQTDAADTDCQVAPPGGGRCMGVEPTITGSGVISGTPGNDVIVGSNGADTINGAGGNDLICARGGNDTVDGGNGDDRANGDGGNDTMKGGRGNDQLNGGTGTDTLRGQGGLDFVGGGTGDDLLLGGDANDRVLGEEGDDELHGGRGNDVLQGGAGEDELRGASGLDRMYGGEDDDDLFGDGDDDLIVGGAGEDRMFGRGGDRDRLTAADGEEDLVDCGPGANDRARVDAVDDVRNCEDVDTV